MKISVAIVTKNRLYFLNNCLKSIKKQSQQPFEIIIIDSSKKNLNKNNIIQIDNIKYFHYKKSGYSYQRNKAIEKSRGDIIAFIDDDCIANKDWIKNIILAHKKNPKVIAIQGKTTYIPINSPFSIIDQFEINNYFQNHESNSFLTVISTKNTSFKRKILIKKNIFFKENSNYNLFGNEDCEIALKLIKLNQKIIFNKNILVQHISRDNIFSYLKQSFRKGIAYPILNKKPIIHFLNEKIIKSSYLMKLKIEIILIYVLSRMFKFFGYVFGLLIKPFYE